MFYQATAVAEIVPQSHSCFQFGAETTVSPGFTHSLPGIVASNGVYGISRSEYKSMQCGCSSKYSSNVC